MKAKRGKDRFISETRALARMEPAPAVDKTQQIKDLLHEFIRNRLTNSSAVEGVKAQALEKLSELMEGITNPSTILRIIESLNRQGEGDARMVMEAGGMGGGGSGQAAPVPGRDIFNLILGGGLRQPQNPGQAPAEAIGVTKEQMALLDTIMQMTESVMNEQDKKTNGTTIDAESEEAD